jgi:hypothetical protein
MDNHVFFTEYCPCLVCFPSTLLDRNSQENHSGAVAMFAVPGLNVAARISAFQSILCALGAVLTGMLLISTHRSRIESNGHTAVSAFYGSLAFPI